MLQSYRDPSWKMLHPYLDLMVLNVTLIPGPSLYRCSSNGENQTSKVQFLNVDQDQSDLPNRKKQDSVYHFSMNLDLKKILLPGIKRIHRPNIDSYRNGSLKKCYWDFNFHSTGMWTHDEKWTPTLLQCQNLGTELLCVNKIKYLSRNYAKSIFNSFKD